MPWLVSMRMMGSVIGAPRTVATRRSVIFNCEGFEFLLTFCTAPSRVSSDQKEVAAAAPANLNRERRAIFLADILQPLVQSHFISFAVSEESERLHSNEHAL